MIQSGTTLTQRTVVGTLATIADRAQEAGIKPPAVLVVGGVVELARKSEMVGNRPLWGKTVLVTRSRDQASRLGGTASTPPGPGAWRCPPSRSPRRRISPLDAALQHLGRYEWVIFTSANGVRALHGPALPYGTGCAGPWARQAGGHRPGHGPGLEGLSAWWRRWCRTFQAEGLLEVLRPKLLGGTRVLIARAEQARDVLPEGLVELGVKVDVVPVYRALPPVSVPPEAAGAGVGQVDIPHLHQFEHGA